MSQTLNRTEVRPQVAEPELLERLLTFEAANWPKGLHRFSLFKRARDGDYVVYRPVVWDPQKRLMHVLKMAATGTPKRDGEWEEWLVDSDDSPLSDVYLVDETVRPSELGNDVEALDDSERQGLAERQRVLDAFCYVDSKGLGKREDYVFNSLVVTDEKQQKRAFAHLKVALGEPRSFITTIKRLFSRYCQFGGVPTALAKLTNRMGGRSKRRPGSYNTKPGPISESERRRRARNSAAGRDTEWRQRPVRPSDIEKFVQAMTKYWASGRKSLQQTYDCMVLDGYHKWPTRLIPSYTTFRYHAVEYLIKDFGLKQLRNGKVLTDQYNNARTGQSSFLTQGVIEIVDIDGFDAKIAIAVRVRGMIKRVHIRVLLAVSRLSGAIVGYELALKGENAEAFRRCIASIYLPKEQRASELGLEDASGLLAGNIDGIFVDNGAGASEAVVISACEAMGLMRMLPPPGRGDYKGTCEGVNNLMILMMADERGGYTRRTDHLSREIRRLKAKNKPITLNEFERLLMLAIQHYNLYTNKKKLRTRAMRDVGVGITPAAIFAYTQKLRRGDAGRWLSPREVYDRFIPWETRVCRRGLVEFMKMRYSSEELAEVFNEHAKAADSVQKPLEIPIKRIDGYAKHLLWRRSDGSAGVIELVDEDARSVGDVTWKGLEFFNEDDDNQEEELRPRRRQSRNRVTVKVQEGVQKAERNRADMGVGSLAGGNLRDARENAQAKRDEKRGRAQAEALAVEVPAVRASKAQRGTAQPVVASSEGSYLQRLKARMSGVFNSDDSHV
jgi:hypothetical protein